MPVTPDPVEPASGPLPPPRKMPSLLKWVAVAVIFFSGVEFFSAANELAMLIKLDSMREALAERPLPATHSAYETLLQSASLYEMGLLGSLRPFRIALAALLCFTSMTALNAALRILRPKGLPREGMRKLLAQAALATALLRTVDGAQAAVMAQKVGLRLKDMLPTLTDSDLRPETIDALRELLPFLPVVASVVFTLLIAGAFLQLWHYLSSDRFKKMLAELDTSKP